jgi:hypothetical protein
VGIKRTERERGSSLQCLAVRLQLETSALEISVRRDIDVQCAR